LSARFSNPRKAAQGRKQKSLSFARPTQNAFIIAQHNNSIVQPGRVRTAHAEPLLIPARASFQVDRVEYETWERCAMRTLRMNFINSAKQIRINRAQP